jgi:hypothetical protein
LEETNLSLFGMAVLPSPTPKMPPHPYNAIPKMPSSTSEILGLGKKLEEKIYG